MTTAATTTMPADLLRIADLTATQLTALLDLADEMKEGPGWWTAARGGGAVACLFDKPSTRTRVSFEVAAHRLGMLPIMLRPDELQLGRGEPLADTARVLSSYTAAIVVRTFAQATLEQLADAAAVPVINGRKGKLHLELGSRRSHDVASACPLAQVFQQRGLADAGFAAQDQHSAAPRAHAGQQPVQRLALAAPAPQPRSGIAVGHRARGG